jgi:hypothetical protein
MMKVEDSLVHVGRLYNLSKVDVKAHFREIEPHVMHVLVVTGQNHL